MFFSTSKPRNTRLGRCMLAVLVGGVSWSATAAETETAVQRSVVRVAVDVKELTRLRSQFDVWGFAPAAADDPEALAAREAVVAVSPAELRELQRLGFRARPDWAVNRRNHQVAASMALARLFARSSSDTIPGNPCYRTVDKTDQDLAALASNNPGLATWDATLGDSIEANDAVHAISITDKAVAGPKAPFVLLATSHAREWPPAEIATRFAEYLVGGYGLDPEITALLRYAEVHIIAIHNPDGRRLSEASNPQDHRKNNNMAHCAGGNFGVDLNRNSEQFWGVGSGSSTNQCSNIYRGTLANSEPETVAANTLMNSVFVDQWDPLTEPSAPSTTEGVMISLHSFSDLVLMPWEAMSSDSPNHAELRTLGRKLGTRLPDYGVCQDCLGTAAGTNVDQAYGRFGVAAYTLEIGGETFYPPCSSDMSLEGFDDVLWPEARDALFYAAKAARRPYLEPSGPEVENVVVVNQWVSGAADDGLYSWFTGGSCFGSASDCAAEPTQAVTGVFYSVDVEPWNVARSALTPLMPADGVWDEVREDFNGSIDLSAHGAGPHLVYLVAEDANGQLGLPTVVWVEGPVFADGFESGTTAEWSSTVP